MKDDTPKSHPHAASMMLYAHDAAETDRPWERWQVREPIMVPEWTDIHGENFVWLPEAEYRRKPRTIRIGEYDVPEPLRVVPARSTQVFWASFSKADDACVTSKWHDHPDDHVMLKRGVLHLTAEAAELHAKALISLSGKP